MHASSCCSGIRECTRGCTTARWRAPERSLIEWSVEKPAPLRRTSRADRWRRHGAPQPVSCRLARAVLSVAVQVAGTWPEGRRPADGLHGAAGDRLDTQRPARPLVRRVRLRELEPRHRDPPGDRCAGPIGSPTSLTAPPRPLRLLVRLGASPSRRPRGVIRINGERIDNSPVRPSC